jgi:osmotically-inducible protein OsmY
MYHFKNVLLVFAIATVGCSTNPKTVDVSDTVKDALKQQGFKDVTVSDDTKTAVVTLAGHVTTDADKNSAEALAKSLAAGQVVADQIAVLPPGEESTAKTVDSDLDKGIERNLDAALVQNGMNKTVDYSVKNGVVKLTGEVTSQSSRAQVQNVAANVPNVRQVVNELQIKNQKATSSY